MKRRHIIGLGYSLVSLEYWQFKPDLSDDAKEQLLEFRISRALRPGAVSFSSRFNI